MCSILNCHRKNKLSYPDDATHLAKWKKVTGPFTDVYGCSKNFGICPIHFPSQKPIDKGRLPSIWLDYKFPERRTYLQSKLAANLN